MRIITGKAKGIRLKTLEGTATRPTAERVKEAVFSTLQFDLEGRCVLDLFSGSGQMGLEAVSRGASHAYLIDKSADAIQVIQSNARNTGLSEACTIIKMDFADFMLQNRAKPFDIIFLDPPYALKLYIPALQGILNHHLLKSTGIIICESNYEDIFGTNDTLASHFRIIKHSKYGKIHITLLSLASEESE